MGRSRKRARKNRRIKFSGADGGWHVGPMRYTIPGIIRNGRLFQVVRMDNGDRKKNKDSTGREPVLLWILMYNKLNYIKLLAY